MQSIAVFPSRTAAFALRLQPGQDVRRTLHLFAQQQRLSAAAVVAAAGSLSSANLRFANEPAGTPLAGPFEIVALSGTLSKTGVHLHMAVSDRRGRTVGGHVVEGCIVYTTLEIVIVELPELSFDRLPDPATGFRELLIRPAGANGEAFIGS